MDDVRFKHDRAGIRAAAVGAEMHLMLIDTGFEAKEFAESISPDAEPYGEGYIASFEVDGSHTERIAGTRRAVCYLRNNADYAWFVEVGNGTYNMGRYVLARTADWVERG